MKRNYICFECKHEFDSEIIRERDITCPKCSNSNFVAIGEPIMATDTISCLYYMEAQKK